MVDLKRVMWICHWESPYEEEWKGGMGIYMRTVGRELTHRGYDIDVFTPRIGDRPAIQELDPHFRVIRVDVNGTHGDIRNSRHMHDFSEAVRGYVRRNGERYGLAHAHYFSSHGTGITMKSEGIPYVIQLHQLYKPRPILFAEAGIEMEVPIDPRFFEYEITAVEEADKVIFVSHSQKEDFRQFYYNGQMPEQVDRKITVVHNGVDTRHFRPAKPGEIRRLKRNYVGYSDAYVLGFVGRLAPLKAAGRILEGFNHLDPKHRQNTHVAVTGEGPDIQHLEKMSRDIGVYDRVHFYGYQTGDDLLDRYQMSDIGIIPTVRETFGLCVAEFMACGKPVIVWKGSGGPEEVVGESGIVVSSSEELANTVTRLLDNKNERRQIGRMARERCVNNFDIRFTAENLAKIYGELSEKNVPVF